MIRNLSDSKPGDIRRQQENGKNAPVQKIMCVGTHPTRRASYWVPWDEKRKPMNTPVDCEPQDLMNARSVGEAPMDCFTLYDAPPHADHPTVLPEEEDLAQDVLDWTTPKQRKALYDGRTVFSIKPTGDPFSSHWEATQIHTTGFVYRGDLPHFKRANLERHLRFNYPDCLISRDD